MPAALIPMGTSPSGMIRRRTSSRSRSMPPPQTSRRCAFLAHVTALHYLREGDAWLTVNLGTGRAHSVLEVIDAVERVTGRPVAVEWANRRPGDPPILVADPLLARKLLAFAPRHSHLDAIIETAWRSRP